MEVNQFVSDCVFEMLKSGIKVILSPESFVKTHEGVEVHGFFDAIRKEFSVAMGDEESWLDIFAHEYCHFHQWQEGMMDNYDDETFWLWLEGKDYPDEKIEEVVRAAQVLEADNERRTVQLIKDKELPIDLEYYIKSCNGYIMFYDVAYKNRNWGKGDDPTYSTDNIMERLNGERIMDDEDLLHAPEWFHKAVLENLNV